MNPDVALLARLRDIHPPAEPAWWPPAPGWWVALVLLVLLAGIAARFGPAWWRRFMLRRRLMAIYQGIARRHRAGAPGGAIAAEVSSLLRVAALARFPQSGVAGLHGEDWIAFLDDCDRTAGRGPGRFAMLRDALTVAPYGRSGATVDVAPLLRVARDWLRAVT